MNWESKLDIMYDKAEALFNRLHGTDIPDYPNKLAEFISKVRLCDIVS